MSDPHGDPSSFDPTRDRYVRQRNAARSWSLAIVAIAVVLVVAYYLHGPFTGSSAPENEPAGTAAPAPPTRGLPRPPPPPHWRSPAGSGRNDRTARVQGAVEKSFATRPRSAGLSVCADETIPARRSRVPFTAPDQASAIAPRPCPADASRYLRAAGVRPCPSAALISLYCQATPMSPRRP